MRLCSISFLGISLIMLTACTRQPTVDVEAEKAALLAADKAWSQSGTDLEKLTSFLADDAMFFGEGMPRMSGKAAIRQTWGEMTRVPGFAISWVADGAVVAASGDLGYTFGSNEISLNNAEGVRTTTKGKYITIWRKQTDGSWKAVVDIGNSDAPPLSAASSKP